MVSRIINKSGTTLNLSLALGLILVCCPSCGIDTLCVSTTRQITDLGEFRLSGSYLRGEVAVGGEPSIEPTCPDSRENSQDAASITFNKLFDVKQAIQFTEIHLFKLHPQTHKHTAVSPQPWGNSKRCEARPETTLFDKNLFIPRETRSGSHTDKDTETLPDPDSRHRSQLDSLTPPFW